METADANGSGVGRGKKFCEIIEYGLTHGQFLCIIVRASEKLDREKYSRGRRGAPAKGVGRDNRRESSNLSFSDMTMHNI